MQTSWQRCDAFKRLGHEVFEIDLSRLGALGQRRVLRRLDGEPFRAANVRRANEEVRALARRLKPDILWLEKGLLIEPESLADIKRETPQTRLVSFQDDNPFGLRGYERGFWRRFVSCIPHYDVHLVKRPSDIANFRLRHARRVELFVTGFYEPVYAAKAPSSPRDWQCDCSFVGTALDDRARVIGRLLEEYRVDVQIYGKRWARNRPYYRHGRHFHPPLSPERHVEVIQSSRVNLNLLSKSNLDDYNGRTFDIPAAGGFLLAERSDFHREHFAEGVEAEFFGSVEELAEKIGYYCRNESRRAAVARAGWERARRCDYSLSRRLREALDLVGEP